MEPLPLLIRSFLALVVLTAAVYDIRFRRIPNWLNLSGLLLGLISNVCFFHVRGATTAIEGFLLATAVYVPLYLMRGMGAGDVKLMAAIGALVGPQAWLYIFIITALIGGACSLALILLHKRAHQTFLNVAFILQELLHARMPS